MDSLGFLSFSLTFSFFQLTRQSSSTDPLSTLHRQDTGCGKKVMELKSLSHHLSPCLSAPRDTVLTTTPHQPPADRTSPQPRSFATLQGCGRSQTPEFTGRLCVWQQLILRIVQRCCQLARQRAEALLLARLGICWRSQRLLGSVLELGRRNLPIDLLLLRELSAAWGAEAAQALVVMAKNLICFSLFIQNNQAVCQEDTLCIEVSKSFLLSQPTCSLCCSTALRGRFLP